MTIGLLKEPDFEAMMKGRTEYMPPRFMSVSTAAQQLMESQKLVEGTSYGSALCIGLARMGQPTQHVVAGTLEELSKIDMGKPLHSLIVCGDVLDYEIEGLKEFLVEGSTYEFPKAEEK